VIDLIHRLIQSLTGARSLSSLKYAYWSAITEVYRILDPGIGPNERPKERELREAFRTTYRTIVRERRRKYQREYTRRWHAANPEKPRAHNRQAARLYREEMQLRKAVDDYCAQWNSLTPTLVIP
jgi:hypothetical protein